MEVVEGSGVPEEEEGPSFEKLSGTVAERKRRRRRAHEEDEEGAAINTHSHKHAPMGGSRSLRAV